MMIREVDKTLAPRAKEANPLGKTAKGLGVFLNALSDAVQKNKKRGSGDQDTLDTPYRSATRSFKLFSSKEASSQDDAALPFKLSLSEEQTQTLDLLKEARSLAADTSHNKLPEHEREAAAERFESIFKELKEKHPQTLAAVYTAGQEPQSTEFSVATSKTAGRAFLNIEEMIVKIFELGTQRNNSGHETALGACGQIKDLLLNEGAQKTFGRFQEIDRANIIGLLK